ncbi:MAG: class I SAM-dependent methyltransferase [Balneolaceae bacterium]
MIPKDIEHYYKLHSKFYDLTRWAFLFGRNSLPKSFPALEKNSQILDLGCGTGKHLEQLAKKYPDSSILGLDRSKDMLRLSNRAIGNSVDIIHDTYSEDSFEKNSFDLILCSYSLTMFNNIEKTIRTIKYHLKTNGVLLVVDFDSTPFGWFSKWMKKNHVSFEPNLFMLLKKEFPESETKFMRAYFGLYSYSLLVYSDRELLIRH